MGKRLSPTWLNVLAILNDGQVHSGENMAVRLGISRTAVWKVVQCLKKQEVLIHSCPQGYYLETPLILLDKRKIEEDLASKIHLTLFEQIPSTQDYLKHQRELKNLNFCFAERQTTGRGRLGRSWHSPFGQNIYFSFVYVFDKDVSRLSGLSLVVSLLIVQTLKSLYPTLPLMLKWPNDIYIDGQKVGGVLIDMMLEIHGPCKAVIGIGLNVNMKQHEIQEIHQTFTSLSQHLGFDLDRNKVAAQIIDGLIPGLSLFAKAGIRPFLQEWETYDWLKNRNITLEEGKKKISGLVQGINTEGHLLLNIPLEGVRSFASGDVLLVKRNESTTAYP